MDGAVELPCQVPRAGAFNVSDRLDELRVLEHQRDAVIGRLTLGQLFLLEELAYRGTALRLAVVVRAVGVGQEAEPIGYRAQREAERVSGPTHEPAQRSCGHAHEHNPALPTLPEVLHEAVQGPHGQQVRDAAAGYPDDVLPEQVLPDVRDIGLRRQREVRDAESGSAEGGVHRR